MHDYYGLPFKVLKEGFIELIFYQMINGVIIDLMHSCIVLLYLLLFWFTLNKACIIMWITRTQSSSHLQCITCDEAYVNMHCQTWNWWRASQSLYVNTWLIHLLTTSSNHYAPICAHKLLYLSHKLFAWHESHELNQEVISI